LNAALWFLLGRFIVSAPRGLRPSQFIGAVHHLSPCPVFWDQLSIRHRAPAFRTHNRRSEQTRRLPLWVAHRPFQEPTMPCRPATVGSRRHERSRGTREIWAIRMRLQLATERVIGRFVNLAIDSELTSCDLRRLRVADVARLTRSNAPYNLRSSSKRQSRWPSGLLK
jgi:hypothetical protein